MPLLPPSHPTHAPLRVRITGRSAVARPPGDSSQPPSPGRIGSLFAIATTGDLSASGTSGTRSRSLAMAGLGTATSGPRLPEADGDQRYPAEGEHYPAQAD